jgi:ABC-type Fe3+/spermidine/putrescine transport system ATPase subunit
LVYIPYILRSKKIISGQGAVLGSGTLAAEDFYFPPKSVWVGSGAGEANCLDRGKKKRQRKERQRKERQRKERQRKERQRKERQRKGRQRKEKRERKKGGEGLKEGEWKKEGRVEERRESGRSKGEWKKQGGAEEGKKEWKKGVEEGTRFLIFLKRRGNQKQKNSNRPFSLRRGVLHGPGPVLRVLDSHDCCHKYPSPFFRFEFSAFLPQALVGSR